MGLKDVLKKRKEEKILKPKVTGASLTITVYDDLNKPSEAGLTILLVEANNMVKSDFFRGEDFMTDDDTRTLERMVRKEVNEYKDTN